MHGVGRGRVELRRVELRQARQERFAVIELVGRVLRDGAARLAEDLSQGDSAREASEADMKVWKLPLSEAVAMVLRGEITDAISMTGLLLVARLKDR